MQEPSTSTHWVEGCIQFSWRALSGSPSSRRATTAVATSLEQMTPCCNVLEQGVLVGIRSQAGSFLQSRVVKCMQRHASRHQLTGCCSSGVLGRGRYTIAVTGLRTRFLNDCLVAVTRQEQTYLFRHSCGACWHGRRSSRRLPCRRPLCSGRCRRCRSPSQSRCPCGMHGSCPPRSLRESNTSVNTVHHSLKSAQTGVCCGTGTLQFAELTSLVCRVEADRHQISLHGRSKANARFIGNPEGSSSPARWPPPFRPIRQESRRSTLYTA